MSRFGESLCLYRRQSSDRERGGRLTQERLGELLGLEMGDMGYTGAAVSEWERGKSQIHKDHRKVLVALIKVLHRNEGLKSTTEADTLLLSGNYRPLDADEKMSIFSNAAPEQIPVSGVDWTTTLISAEQWVAQMGDLLKKYIDEYGPRTTHRGSRLFLGSLGFFFNQWSFEITLKLLLWLGLWVAVQKFVFSMLHWPFADQAQAWESVVCYMGGVLALPALAALLTNTNKDIFWQQQNLAGKPILRLYTYVGAFMGFNIGYGMVFGVALIGYYLGIKAAPPLLVILGAAWPLVLAYSAARQAPFNHWRAYGDLRLADGGLLLLTAGIALGPMLGVFFYAYHPLLLEPLTGIILFIVAVGLLYLLTAWQKKRGHDVIPAHAWVILWGTIAVLYAASQGAGLFWSIALGALLVVMAGMLARQRLHFNLLDMTIYLVGLITLLISLRYHFWMGGVGVFLAIAAWRWYGGKKQGRFPFSLWLFMVALGIGAFLLKEGILDPPGASLLVGLSASAVILWAVRKEA